MALFHIHIQRVGRNVFENAVAGLFRKAIKQLTATYSEERSCPASCVQVLLKIQPNTFTKVFFTKR